MNRLINPLTHTLRPATLASMSARGGRRPNAGRKATGKGEQLAFTVDRATADAVRQYHAEMWRPFPLSYAIKRLVLLGLAQEGVTKEPEKTAANTSESKESIDDK